jgi:hypothetical protein
MFGILYVSDVVVLKERDGYLIGNRDSVFSVMEVKSK